MSELQIKITELVKMIELQDGWQKEEDYIY